MSRDEDLEGPMGEALGEITGDRSREIGNERKAPGGADVADPLDEVVDRGGAPGHGGTTDDPEAPLNP